ncbi:DUF1523 family protein [Rhodobacter capsulatus]|uniref:DUF1523 family protein n=1 Tax=Rhodobacter capsulatus TaxID=1061 RepID=UPI0040278315
MGYVKWAFWLLVVAIFGSFLHYTLPRHEIVRVVNIYQERQDLSGWTSIFWSGPDVKTTNQTSYDVQFISAVTPEGKPMVYRNEDTGWGWPPYFKFDTANLSTQAADLQSTAEAPKWGVMTYYGWRSQLFSIFPNAVRMRPVDSPDVTIIPWFNIIFLTLLTMAILTVRALWIQFRRNSIDPVLGDVADAIEDVTDRAGSMFDDVTGKK